MKRFNILFLIGAIFILSSATVFSQERQIIPNVLNAGEEEELIREFTRNEAAFQAALTRYVFTRKVLFQTIGLGGLITGTYIRNSNMTLTEDGERFEKFISYPVSTLKEITVENEDIDDFGGANLFAINPEDAKQYTYSYVGKQRIDDLNLHVFDIRPKVMPDPKKSTKRYFMGRIWVDDRDKLIVRAKGKGVPEGEQRFPVVDTWRQNIDGKYWFPVFASSDDELVFGSGQVVKIRLRIEYELYRQGRSSVTVLDDTEIIEDEKPAENKPPMQNPPPPPPPV